jgi:phenylacetate-CoA ligase
MIVTKYNYFDEKREKTPSKELEENWVKRGRWTLKKLYNNSSFLKKRYQDAGISPESLKTVADFKKVPHMKKQDFLDSFPYQLLCIQNEDIVRMHATSGTSGHRPTCGFYSQKDLEDWSYLCARNLGAIGMTKRDVFQNTTSSGLFTGGFGYAQGCTVLGAMLIPFGPGFTSRQLEFFKIFKVTAFHAIPSFGLRIAQVMEEEDIKKDDLYLKFAILGAEGWAESTRKTIEERLGVKAYDNWGMTEAYGPGPSVECQEQNGLHIWSDYFYPEIIDPKTGDLLSYGETGELVITSLHKEAAPIFRYRTGDITALYTSECHCGRTGFIMDRVKGRKDDMKIIRGVNIYPSLIEEEIFGLSHFFTDIYLITYHTVGVMDTITVKVEARPNINRNSAKKKLEKNLREATMLSIKVIVSDPGTLPLQEGKAIRYQDLRDRKDKFYD